MNKYFRILSTAFLFFVTTGLSFAEETDSDTIYIQTTTGIDLFPREYVSSFNVRTRYVIVKTIDGQNFQYNNKDLVTYDHQLDIHKPSITSFKFNNKFNYGVFSDVECEIVGDSLIRGAVPSISRWLTPSFQLTDKNAVVSADTVRLVSKVTHVRLDRHPVITVGYPGVRVFRKVITKPAVTETVVKERNIIPLTVNMLSTNAPGSSNQGLDKMLDNNTSTFFHSTWSKGDYTPLPLDSCPYIEINLTSPVKAVQYVYSNRYDTGERSALALSLQVSTDGERWVEKQTFTEADGLSPEQGATNTSPVCELDQPYSRFRLVMTKANYKNYLCVSEFKLYKVTVEHNEVEPAEYKFNFTSFGRDYEVQIDWLSDRAKGVPRIDVNVEGGALVSSKYDYLNATIAFDGAGVFPSMEATPVLIRGRGNSSWSSNPSSKNPYRLKFEEKVKPFGLKKGKSWVLQANRQTGSMMTNAIGMELAGLVGTEAPNHVIPVELYMNGDYWGSYCFTEKVGLANNSVDLPDEQFAAMLELDQYYDEPHRFRTTYYDLPVNIKEPDFDDPSSTGLLESDVHTRFNAFCKLVRDGQDISEVVDVTTLARFLMVNEFIGNYELHHPKSTFLYHENLLEDTCKFKWGPVWDLDWAYGYSNNHTYFLQMATTDFWATRSQAGNLFMRKLRQAGEPLDREIYKTWRIFMERGHLDELLEFCDEYYNFARTSLENNRNAAHGRDRDATNYATSTANAKKWLQQRAATIYAGLTPYDDLTAEEVYGYDPDADFDLSGIFTDGINPTTDTPRMPARFDVYDLRGVQQKRGATFDTFREGLAPGIYIVNGRKVLIQ